MPKKKPHKSWDQHPPQERLRKWIWNNRKNKGRRWYTASIEDIVAESGASESTVNRYFHLLVSRVAKIPPSKVSDRRRKHKGLKPWNRNLRPDEIEEIIKLYYEGNTTLDIAFMTGRSEGTVARYRPQELKDAGFLNKRTLEEHKRRNPEVFGHIGPDMTEEDIENAKERIENGVGFTYAHGEPQTSPMPKKSEKDGE